jgi:hypothetical protein
MKKPNAAQLNTLRAAALMREIDETEEEGAQPPVLERPKEPERPDYAIDGRSLRATGRTLQFATRVRPETSKRMRQIAKRDKITLGGLIELAVEAYERERARASGNR